MAAAQRGKLKSRRKCEKREGGRRDPLRDMWRLRQKEEARVTGSARRRGAGVRRSERGSEGRGRAKEEERDPKKKTRRSLRPSGVWGGTFISRTLRKADG